MAPKNLDLHFPTGPYKKPHRGPWSLSIPFPRLLQCPRERSQQTNANARRFKFLWETIRSASMDPMLSINICGSLLSKAQGF